MQDDKKEQESGAAAVRGEGGSGEGRGLQSRRSRGEVEMRNLVEVPTQRAKLQIYRCPV